MDEVKRRNVQALFIQVHVPHDAVPDQADHVNRGVLGSSLYAEALPDGVDILTIDGKQVPQ